MTRWVGMSSPASRSTSDPIGRAIDCGGLLGARRFLLCGASGTFGAVERLQELERQAETGAADARFALGVELLSGDDPAQHFKRAIALIEGASADGHAPATELCAVFEAMGVARPQSWERAFDRLLDAALQGSGTARGQLQVLARDHGEPASLRSAIDLPGLLSCPDRASLSDSPRIRTIDGFATPGECRWLTERARTRLRPATIIAPDGMQALDPGRSNTGTEFQVLDMDVVLEIIRARISAATKLPVPLFEWTQVLRYEVGQEFKPHHDFLDPSNLAYGDQARFGQRIATFLIYLNDDFEGGETDFPKAEVRYRGRAGDAIFFANVDRAGKPDPLTLHAGLPPTSGEKWILSQWIRDRAGSPA